MEIIKKGMSFSQALEEVKQGRCVCREGWNGKGMFIFLIPGEILKVGVNAHYGDGYTPVDDVIALTTAQGSVQVGWVPSQADLLREDWCLVDAQGQVFEEYAYTAAWKLNVEIYGHVKGIKGDKWDRAVVTGVPRNVKEAIESRLTEGVEGLTVEVEVL